MRTFTAAVAGVLVFLFFAASGEAAWNGTDDRFSEQETTFQLFGNSQVPVGGFQPRTTVAPTELAFADDITGAIVRQLQRGTAECGRLDPIYRIDCMRQAYLRASGAAGNRPDYAGANSELRGVSRKLNGILRQHQDRKAPKVTRGNRTYRAVARSALRQANKQASQAIGEAATKLLRSAANSKKRKVHYTRIANAVNSTKKILRS